MGLLQDAGDAADETEKGRQRGRLSCGTCSLVLRALTLSRKAQAAASACSRGAPLRADAAGARRPGQGRLGASGWQCTRNERAESQKGEKRTVNKSLSPCLSLFSISIGIRAADAAHTVCCMRRESDRGGALLPRGEQRRKETLSALKTKIAPAFLCYRSLAWLSVHTHAHTHEYTHISMSFLLSCLLVPLTLCREREMEVRIAKQLFACCLFLSAPSSSSPLSFWLALFLHSLGCGIAWCKAHESREKGGTMRRAYLGTTLAMLREAN